MTTEGWPDDRLTSSDVPSLVRHHAGPVEDPDRYELLGVADGADEAWHVLDHRAATGEALFTLAALRPRDVADLEVRHGEDEEEESSPEELWRERAAGLARVRHARLAGVVGTFSGPAPHPPGQAATDGPGWSYAVLEQAAGRSVADWLRDDPGAGVEERFTVLATAASVLSELHRGSEDAPPLVHGDVTPRSVRLGGFWPADGVRLAGASLGGLRRGPLHSPHTVWTAPEVRAGALPSAAADVFGFGATAFLLLTGTPPATSPDGDVDPSLVRRQLAAAPLTAPHPGLADLLLQALSPDPAQRPDRLPAWVNGLRAFVEPRPSLDPYDAQSAPTQFVPVTGARSTRSVPKRPVVVVVGALLLATAGTAVAVTAVQQGTLRDVPNPVAIVQPPRESTAVPTSGTTSVPQPATTAGTGASSTSRSSRGGGGQAPSTRRGTPAQNPVQSPSDGAPTGQVPGSPPPSAGTPPALVPPPATGAAPGQTPTASAIPPLTGPTAPPTTAPPTTAPPTTRPTPSTPSTIRPPTRTPVVTPPTRTPVVTPPVVTPPVVTSPVVTPGTPTTTRSLPPATPSTPPVGPSTSGPAGTPTTTTTATTAPPDPLTPRSGPTP